MAQESIPLSWVVEKNKLLKRELPPEVQKEIFKPDVNFYVQYIRSKDKREGLHYMAALLFGWLNIEVKDCVVDFYNESEFKNASGDTAGFYTKRLIENKEREIILINSKHQEDSFAVAAILAHEMMHLYLYRHNLKLDDTKENELLTDLATINTGLGVLILNGMSYSNEWFLTVIMAFLGRIYWKSHQLAFGYFKPKEYGEHVLSYLQEKGLSSADILGYLKPTSRSFIPHGFMEKPKSSNEFMRILERQHRKSNLIKGSIVVVALIIVVWFGSQDNSSNNVSPTTPAQQTIYSQITACKGELSSMETEANTNIDHLTQMKKEMDDYKTSGDIEDHNALVDPYNTLLQKVNDEKAAYESELSQCNNLIDKYNSL